MHSRKPSWVWGLWLLLLGPPLWAGQSVDHAPWDELLRRYVQGGLIDYQSWQADQAALDRYLASLQEVDPAQLPSREEQLAFWINLYNASVVKGVLRRFPVKSVKQVPGFFDGLMYPVNRKLLTLNEIEEQARLLGDWRIHFALVCASSSCPRLRSEAYVPERVNDQLTEQTTQFLSNPQRGLRIEGKTLWLSKIFQWYTTDFVPTAKGFFHRLTPDALLPVLKPYLAPEVAQAIERRKLQIQFLDYDWTLNATR
jgi:hypothetical protein